MLIDHPNFYLKSIPDQISYENFIQVNYQQYYYLLNHGFLEYTHNLFAVYLLHLLKNKPFVFIDNQIHLLYQSKDQNIINQFQKSLIKLITCVIFKVSNDFIVTFSDINYQLTIPNPEFEELDFAIIIDSTKTLLSKLIWQYHQLEIINPKTNELLNLFKENGISFKIPPRSDVFRLPKNDWLEFLESSTFKPNFKLKNDFLPDHQDFEPQKHTVLCSLINTLSFTFIDLIEAANFIKKFGVNFAISPDLECLAFTPKNFEVTSKIFQNNILKFIEQEKIGQLLDLKITSSRYPD